MITKSAQVLPELTSDPELIVIDDGSVDGSGILADQMAREIQFLNVVHHPQNLGYGAALRSGFKAATKEVVFYTDSDGQFDVSELRNILPLVSHYEVISCYRIGRKDKLIRRLNARIFEFLMAVVFGLKVQDPDCAFKIYSQKVLTEISMSSNGALIDVEMLIQAQRHGFTIYQTGVTHWPRVSGRSTGGDLRVIFRAFFEVLELSRRLGTRFNRRNS